MIRIALDAMGSDNAPRVEVEGAALALRELAPTFRIQLVGRSRDIEACLSAHGPLGDRVEIVEAPEVVGMGEKPLVAFKRKPRSSISIGLGLQTRAESDAFISAGNTGAVMAAATLLLGLHPGVARAAIAALFPSPDRPVLVIDGGANVDCDARELASFAQLGMVYARDVLDRPEPAVGLLNVGEEEEKGSAVVRQANQLLKAIPGMHYVGHVEGRDILTGTSARGPLDVVVCDGFIGNAVLKFYEEAGRMFSVMLRATYPEAIERPESRRLFEFLDYSTYGGAPLLGIKGVAIICHGRSPARAIMNAIRVAVQAVQHHLSRDIGAQFAEGSALA